MVIESTDDLSMSYMSFQVTWFFSSCNDAKYILLNTKHMNIIIVSCIVILPAQAYNSWAHKRTSITTFMIIKLSEESLIRIKEKEGKINDFTFRMETNSDIVSTTRGIGFTKQDFFYNYPHCDNNDGK